MVNSLSDPFVFDLITKYGGTGYLVYFGTLEILGEQQAINKPFFTTLDYMSYKLHTDKTKLIEVLQYIEDKGKFVLSNNEDGSEISIFCPKFMEFSDNWTSRNINYRETTEKLPNEENRIDKNRREKKKNIKDYGNARELVAHFYKLWESKKGEVYPNCSWGKHGSRLKQAMKTTPESKLKELMELYFSDTSDFVLKNGHSLEIFLSSLPGLITKDKTRVKSFEEQCTEYEKRQK